MSENHLRFCHNKKVVVTMQIPLHVFTASTVIKRVMLSDIRFFCRKTRAFEILNRIVYLNIDTQVVNINSLISIIVFNNVNRIV